MHIFFLTLTLPLVLVTWQRPSPGLQNGAQRGQSQSVVQEPGEETPVSGQLSPDHTGSYHSTIKHSAFKYDGYLRSQVNRHLLDNLPAL